jgi:hypothetical protein
MTARSQNTFYPATPHPLLVGLVQWSAPLAAQWRYKFEVVADSESLERLRSLRDQRLLLLPNHTCFDDPPVMFTLSGRVGLRFQYLAALELFQSKLGIWLQRLGTYSIRRGFGDRTSVAYTLDLLCDPDCKLVIFAEGGCSFQNDTVLSFRSGAIQMAFQALNRFHKRSEPLPNLYLLPVGIKYRYSQDMSAVIESSLQELEKTLHLHPNGSSYQRLTQIATQRLEFWEQEFDVKPEPDWRWTDRMAHLKATILAIAEQQLDLETVLNDTDRDRAYRLESVLNAIASDESSTANTANLTKLGRGVKQVLHYAAIHNGYVAEFPTQERFLDTLTCLERDVFNIDQPPPKGHRQAHVKVAEPINLKTWFPNYLRDRSGTVDLVNQLVHSQSQDQVNQLSSAITHPNSTLHSPLTTSGI